MTLGERIKKVRKGLDLTQQKFADQIGTTQNNIASYEIGRREPSAAAVNNICKTFNVSETWLRTGEGDMFVKQTEDDELAMVFSAIAASDDDLIKRIIRAYWKLDDKEKAAVRKLIDGFTSASSDPSAPVFAPTHTLTIEEEARAETEQQARLIYKQILSEKKAEAERSSESSVPKAGGGTAKRA